MHKTLVILFKSKKIMLTSVVILINWFTNSCVYYGISFNTTDQVGNFVLTKLKNLRFFASQYLIGILLNGFFLDR